MARASGSSAGTRIVAPAAEAASKTSESSMSRAQQEEGCRFLERYVARCEAEWNYDEAAVAYGRLQDLKRQLSDTSQADLLARQQSTQRIAQARHAQALQDHEQRWQERMDEFGAWEEASRGELLETQQEDFEEHVREMQQDTAELHVGREVMDLRCRAKTLAGLQQYADATLMKWQAEDLEDFERMLFQAKQNGQKNDGGKQPFIHKQKCEREGLETRIWAKRMELERSRRQDLERLEKHHRNEMFRLSSVHFRELRGRQRPSSAPLPKRRCAPRKTSAVKEAQKEHTIDPRKCLDSGARSDLSFSMGRSSKSFVRERRREEWQRLLEGYSQRSDSAPNLERPRFEQKRSLSDGGSQRCEFTPKVNVGRPKSAPGRPLAAFVVFKRAMSEVL